MEKTIKLIAAIVSLICALLSAVVLVDYLKLRGYKLPGFMKRRQRTEKCCCENACDHTEYLSSESAENTEDDTYF